MFGVTDFWLFVVSGLALNILPGSDSLYIIRRSAGQVFRAGSVASLGIGAGTLIHIFAAAFGLSAILATSALAFTIIKIIGCVYLLYIGLTMLFAKERKQDAEQKLAPIQKNIPLSTIFYQGFLTNTLNPKVALFFLAFVPQFISADAPNKTLAFLFLGLVFNVNGMLWRHFLAWTSSSVSKKLKQNPLITKYLSKFAGGLFLYFEVKLILSEQG